MTQTSKIKAHLLAGKSITPVQAMATYGISRLASVIEDLRLAGMQIDMLLKRDESGKQYGWYRLRKDPQLGSRVRIKPGYAPDFPRWVRSMREGVVIHTWGAAGTSSRALSIQFERGELRKQTVMHDKEVVCVD